MMKAMTKLNTEIMIAIFWFCLRTKAEDYAPFIGIAMKIANPTKAAKASP